MSAKHPLLTIEEAAEYLRCSDTHIRSLMDRGLLKSQNIGLGEKRKRIRIRRVDLDNVNTVEESK